MASAFIATEGIASYLPQYVCIDNETQKMVLKWRLTKKTTSVNKQADIAFNSKQKPLCLKILPDKIAYLYKYVQISTLS